MNAQNLSRRPVLLLVLAGIMTVASMLSAAPAAAAKQHASVSVFCFSGGPQNYPGYALTCQAFVQGIPAPTGALTISVPSYRGTASTEACSFVTSCSFTYTPTGKGSSYRKDTITMRYSGDDHYYSARFTTKVPVAEAPPIGLQLSCPATTTTGAFTFCSLSIQTHGFTGTPVSLKVATYRGDVTPTECYPFQSSCSVFYIPKGRGYASRVDTITASYPGDIYNSPNKVTAKIHVGAAP